MYTLTAPRSLLVRTPRRSNRWFVVRRTELRACAVLKNGGFRNGDAARRGDDEHTDEEMKRAPRRSFRASSLAMDSDRRDPVAFDDEKGSAVVPDDASRGETTSHDDRDEFSDFQETDDVPLYRSLTRDAARSVSSESERSKSPSDTSCTSRWPALVDTAAEFDEESAMRRGAAAPMVSPPWRVMLLSDGSVTRHLQLLTDASVRVDVLGQRLVLPSALAADASVPPDVVGVLTRMRCCDDVGVAVDLDAPPAAFASRAARMVHREVDLCDGNDGTPLVYASSWWTEEAATRYGILTDTGGATSKPVWLHLSDGKTELYREIKRMYLGNSPRLEKAWNVSGPFLARHYIFWAGAQPLCVIYEVFSPKLEKFLGAKELTHRA